MAKSMPKAGRPAKASGSKPAPKAAGLTTGKVRDRAGITGAFNPLGSVNRPEGGYGNPAPRNQPAGKPLPKQGR